MPHTIILGIALLAVIWAPILMVRSEAEPKNELQGS